MKGTVPQNSPAPTMQPTLKIISIPCMATLILLRMASSSCCHWQRKYQP